MDPQDEKMLVKMKAVHSAMQEITQTAAREGYSFHVGWNWDKELYECQLMRNDKVVLEGVGICVEYAICGVWSDWTVARVQPRRD